MDNPISSEDKKQCSKPMKIVLLLISIAAVIYMAMEGLLFNYLGFFSVLIWLWLLLFLVVLFFAGKTLFTSGSSWLASAQWFVWIYVIIMIVVVVNVWVEFIPYDDVDTGDTTEVVDVATTNDSDTAVTTDSDTEASETTETAPLATKVLLPAETFSSGLGDWYEHVWYKSADSGGEVTFDSNGLTLTGLKSNSRSGIMIDVNADVTGYDTLILAANVTANTQTLTGTGWNGREAPVAVAVGYVDADGVTHAGLGEDPTAAGQMFWRGFYFLDPDGNSGVVNGVKVEQGVPYNFTFDLMTLDPKPATINFVGIEGAGWQDRVGKVAEISLTAN